MALQYMGTKYLALPLRSRALPSPFSFPPQSIPSSSRPHRHRRLSHSSSSLAVCLKAIRSSANNHKLYLSSGNLPFRALISDWRRISFMGSAAAVAEQRVSTQQMTGVAGASPSLNLSTDTLSADEQQQTSAGGRKMIAVRDTIELTDNEERIFAVLTATLKHFGLKTQLRVAGGWVRDKLIGRNSVDIDIALDDMLGRVFCEKVNDYQQTKGEETHDFGVIQRNPEQSKHLETANMKVLGMHIDFVNLRAETYTETSRIPEMEFGSPEQDAYRRDLTINSLFYNINTRMVEDFTKQGIADLKSGIIRTPLPPSTTFLDDPLRVCRAIRFGARFEFTLDQELKKAAASEAVRIALQNKVSRYRIGHEIELMLMGNQPGKAMQYLEDLSLFSAVFLVPKEAEPDPPILESCGRLCVDALQSVLQVLAKFRYASRINPKQLRLLLFGALFLPVRSCTCFLGKKKGKKLPVSTYLFRESLKLTNNDASGVETLHNLAPKFQLVIKQLLQLDLKDFEHEESATFLKQRVELGLLLMNGKELWRSALLLASVMELPSLKPLKGADTAGLPSDSQTRIREIAEMCNAVEDIVTKLGLTSVWESKPLLGGDEIMAALKLRPGLHVQEWKERIMVWQLGHPQGTAEECFDWLVEENVKRIKTSVGAKCENV